VILPTEALVGYEQRQKKEEQKLSNKPSQFMLVSAITQDTRSKNITIVEKLK